MLYIYLDTSEIKLMYLKKSLLGQYDTVFCKKHFNTKLIQNGLPISSEIIASGLKEALNGLNEQQIKEKNVSLVLPQEAFLFFRADMPVDVTESVLDAYLCEKARSILNSDVENSCHDYIIKESEGVKKILFYAIKKDVLKAFSTPLTLLGFNLSQIIPASLAIFKLFEKTLRTNKKETIWYVSYDQDSLSGYLYDSHGLLEPNRWTAKIQDNKIEGVIQKQVSKFGAQATKLNRLILSGGQSANVRQDTFTKNVGVWTNPLRRIIPNFYDNYLKILKGQKNSELPVLIYDMLIGGYIFSSEESNFSLLESTTSSDEKKIKRPGIQIPSINISKKTIGLSIISFAVTFGILFGISILKSKGYAMKFPKIPFINSALPAPTKVLISQTQDLPTLTPTPKILKEKVKIKILNGSGIRGKAVKVKNFLKEAGYEDMLTDNADSFDYETTILQYKKGQEDLKLLLTKDIQTEVEDKIIYEDLDTNEAADLILIVGTDFK